MKLLFFASNYQSGLTPYLVDQAIALNSKIRDLFVISGEKDMEIDLEKKLEKNGIPLFRIHGLDEHYHFLSLSQSILEIIKQNNIEVIHVQTNWQLCLVAYLKYKVLLLRKIKIIYTIHSFRNNEKIKALFARWAIMFELLLFANKVICSCNYIEKKFKLLSYKITRIPLGVNDIFFQTTPLQNKSLKQLYMIFPAQFRKGKNQDLLITAFADYVNKSSDKNSILYLPGEGELKKSMIILAKKKGIADQVIFPGFLSKTELHKLFQQCNIGLIPSNSETFGFCIIEPLVMGKCVITRPVGVAQDIIKDGINGFLFEKPQDLTNILMQLRALPNLLESIVTHNEDIRENFRWSNIANQYFKMIQEL